MFSLSHAGALLKARASFLLFRPGCSSFCFRSADSLSKAELDRHGPYMERAIVLARAASGAPFGALIVDRRTGDVLCEGSNKGDENPLLHGEIVTILTCGKEDIQRPDLTIYSTAEPCSMCFGAIAWAGISEIIYATSLEKLRSFGARQAHIDSFEHAKASEGFPIGKGSIIGGVLSEKTDPMYRIWAESLKRNEDC